MWTFYAFMRFNLKVSCDNANVCKCILWSTITKTAYLHNQCWVSAFITKATIIIITAHLKQYKEMTMKIIEPYIHIQTDEISTKQFYDKYLVLFSKFVTIFGNNSISFFRFEKKKKNSKSNSNSSNIQQTKAESKSKIKPGLNWTKLNQEKKKG